MDKIIFQAEFFRATVTVWRRLQSLTIGELSDLTNISPTRLGAIENGGVVPTLPELTHLCDVMQSDPRDYFRKARE